MSDEKNMVKNLHEVAKKVAIIGSGPSGLTAAIYTSRANIATDIYLGDMPGGQLTTTTEIENFPGFVDGIDGPLLMENMQKQAQRFGANLISESVTKLDYTNQNSNNASPTITLTANTANGVIEKTYDAIIIATGAKARYLGVKGEEVFIGKGYHTCATCDGFFYRNKTIAVVGGGDSAMEEASYLAKLASKVYVIHRSDNFKASKIMYDRAVNNPKIEFITFKTVSSFITEDKGFGAEFAGINLISTLKDGANSEEELKIDGLFVAIGHIPNSDFVSSLSLDKDEIGYLISQQHIDPEFRVSNYNTATKLQGIFVAGDVEDKLYRQAITAAGDGCRAAMEVEKYLEN